jgi:AraC-like DNA-binding protein
MMVTPGYTVARFSSRDLPKEGRGRAIEELHERGLLGFRFSPYGEALSTVDFANRSMPGLRIVMGAYAGVSRAPIPDKEDPLYLCLVLSGTSLFHRRDRQVVLSGGDAVLMSARDAPFTVTSRALVRIAGIRVPRSALASLLPGIDDAVMRRIPADATALRLLRKYLGVVVDDDILSDSVSQRVVTGHLHDLIAMALGSEGASQKLAETTTVRAVRLAAVKAYVLANLHDAELGVAKVAACNSMSERYLHKLFQSEHLTYSEFVLGQRLARAYGLLRNPLYFHCKISVIAFELGFNDLSYFNRTFRRRYGATPSDVRARGCAGH